MSTVYISHDDGRFDLSDVRRFGIPVQVFTRELWPDTAQAKMPSAMAHAHHTLQYFRPDEDYLCLVGAPIYTAVCSFILGRMGKPAVRLLRFDRVEGSYYPIEMTA